LMMLLSMSNQKGAPMTMAKEVSRIPRTFKACSPGEPGQMRMSFESRDHPIGGVLLRVFLRRPVAKNPFDRGNRLGF
jgi:hypothetical protein